MDRSLWRNRFGFSIGTMGRDMVATMVTMYLMFYATDILQVSNETLAGMTGIMMFMRVFDGLNDPFMGTLVDNTRSRWGKFKPWILFGAIFWAIAHVFMFTDFGFRGFPFLLIFTLVYIFWEVSYTANDIAYWSMLPALTKDLHKREKISSTARIFANIGMFAFVVALIPVTDLLEQYVGTPVKAWFALAIITAILMLFFQVFTLVLAREERQVTTEEKTRFTELFRIILRNDQLMIITAALLLFMTGYTLTTGLGIYYFKYLFGDEGLYSIFALVLGVSQIAGLIIFPLLAKRRKRSELLVFAITIILMGYVGFFLSPYHMVPIAISGVFIFVGQAFIQVMMLLYISDCVEYGEWKFGKRNESVTFSLQPLIYKVSNAFATGLMGLTVIVTGLREASGPEAVTYRSSIYFKGFMMLLPALLILLCFLIIHKFYKVDERFYRKIISDNQLKK